MLNTRDEKVIFLTFAVPLLLWVMSSTSYLAFLLDEIICFLCFRMKSGSYLSVSLVLFSS